jgi:hypothetical protein
MTHDIHHHRCANEIDVFLRCTCERERQWDRNRRSGPPGYADLRRRADALHEEFGPLGVQVVSVAIPCHNFPFATGLEPDAED